MVFSEISSTKSEILRKIDFEFPPVDNVKWIKGFEWKGIWISIQAEHECINFINEFRSLNLLFFEYIQILDTCKVKTRNNLILSNDLLFPLISYVKFFGLVLTASVCLKQSYFNINVVDGNSEYQRILKSMSIFSDNYGGDGYSEKKSVKQDSETIGTGYYFGAKRSETSLSFIEGRVGDRMGSGKHNKIMFNLTEGDERGKIDKIDFKDFIDDKFENDRKNEEVSVLNTSLNASNGVIHNEINAVKNIGIKNEEEFNLKEYYRDDLNLSNLFKNISEKNLFKIKVNKSEKVDESLVESKFLIISSFDLIPNLIESSTLSNFLYVSEQEE